MNLFNQYFLQIVLLAPLAAILHISFIKNIKSIKLISFFYSIFILLLCFILIIGLSKQNNTEPFQFVFAWNWFSSLSANYGVDGISVWFILLTAFLIPVCLLTSWESISFRFREFVILLFFIEFILFQVFSVLNILLFYIGFEAVLIPMFIMIGVWGSRKRKISASYQFFLYTFLGSVAMLASIAYIYNTTGTLDYLTLTGVYFDNDIQIILWLCFFVAFAVKTPMVPIHTWLPEAHVEAPTAGSVLLAGVLLKLGLYGLIRFSLVLFPFGSVYFTPFVLLISVISVIYSSFATLRQVDMKKLIAYSSIAHMNLVTIGIFSGDIIGIEGASLLMLSHGIVSGGLFICVGVLYDRYHKRHIMYYGGLVSLMPIYTCIFLIFIFGNMGLPGTSSAVGEILIFISSFSINKFVTILLSTSVIFSAAYSVWLANRILFGSTNERIFYFSDLNRRELFCLIFLSIFVIFFGVYPNYILEFLHFPSSLAAQSSTNWNFSLVFCNPFVESGLEFSFDASNYYTMMRENGGIWVSELMDKVDDIPYKHVKPKLFANTKGEIYKHCYGAETNFWEIPPRLHHVLTRNRSDVLHAEMTRPFTVWFHYFVASNPDLTRLEIMEMYQESPHFKDHFQYIMKYDKTRDVFKSEWWYYVLDLFERQSEGYRPTPCSIQEFYNGYLSSGNVNNIPFAETRGILGVRATRSIA